MAHSHHRHGRLGRETWQMFSPSQYDQCAQTKAILEKIYSTEAEDLQLRTLHVSLSKKWYTSIDCSCIYLAGYIKAGWPYPGCTARSCPYPKKKMEMVAAKMERVEIYELWQVLEV